ncbi:hypothetical protein HZA41_00950 [Candidatus Peregrinibacteria bacterium]|nr:hypothetical protein [Candidatus Peregrinibacteria bacterium]
MNIPSFFMLFRRAIRSFSRKEEIFSLVFFVLLLFSGYHIFFGGNAALSPDEFSDMPTSGGAYSEGLIGRVMRLNPLYTEFNAVDRDISRLVFSGLSQYDPVTGEIVEDLATHSLSSDKKTYTFTVKDNVFWHDGEPVTAEDVYFTYHDIIQSENFKNFILRSNFDGVDIKIIDKKTITFTLSEVNSFFFSNTTIGLLPKHILGGMNPADLDAIEFNQMPIGSGPYKMDGPVKNFNKEESQVNLMAFDGYYGEKPRISNVRFFTFPDEKALYKARNSLNGLSRITVKEEIEELSRSGRYQLFPYTLPQYTAFFLNMESPIAKEYLVRLALAKSLDRTALVKELSYKKQIDTALLELSLQNSLFRVSRENAMGALYASGWRYREDDVEKKGWRVSASGKVLELRLVAQSFSENTARKAETEAVIAFAKKAWEGVGVKITVEMYDQEIFEKKVKKSDYDILLSGQALGYNMDTYSYWHSSQVSGNGLNVSNYKNPVADNLIEAIRNIFDPEVKRAKLEKLAETIASDIPALFLYSPVYYFSVDSRIKGVSIGWLAFPSDRLTHLVKWYIKER